MCVTSLSGTLERIVATSEGNQFHSHRITQMTTMKPVNGNELTIVDGQTTVKLNELLVERKLNVLSSAAWAWKLVYIWHRA